MARTTLGTYFARVALLASFLAFPLLGGCGGDNPGNPSPQPVSGIVRGADGVGLPGYTVVFDRGGPVLLSTTTASDGSFTLLVPLYTITGHDTLSLLDAAGRLSAIVPVALNGSSIAPVSLPPIAVGPPPPPTGI